LYSLLSAAFGKFHGVSVGVVSAHRALQLALGYRRDIGLDGFPSDPPELTITE
jgi:hypothetical protein